MVSRGREGTRPASGLLGGPLVDGVLDDGREDGPALLLLLGHGSDAAERGQRDDGRGDEASDEPGVVVAGRLLLLLGAAAAAAARRALDPVVREELVRAVRVGVEPADRGEEARLRSA